MIEISSRLCRFAGRNCSVTFWQITTKEAFKSRKPSHKTLFLKAADIICPSLLPSCGSVRLKPTTSSQRTSRLQAAVGPHSDAAAALQSVARQKEKNAVFTKNQHPLVNFRVSSVSSASPQATVPQQSRLIPTETFLLLNTVHIALFRSGRLREIHTEQIRDRRFR